MIMITVNSNPASIPRKGNVKMTRLQLRCSLNTTGTTSTVNYRSPVCVGCIGCKACRYRLCDQHAVKSKLVPFLDHRRYGCARRNGRLKHLVSAVFRPIFSQRQLYQRTKANPAMTKAMTNAGELKTTLYHQAQQG